jgi:TolA-binding protein
MKVQLLTVALFFAVATPAMAQCPGPVAGNTAEEIAANRERIVCLQQELNAATRERQRQMELDALNRRLRELETQRQIDRMQFDVPVYRPPVN